MKKTRASQNTSKTLSRMSKLVKRERDRIPGGNRRRVVSPTEQIHRFIRGEEQWRVDAGLVSQENYDKYSAKMLRALRERQDADKKSI